MMQSIISAQPFWAGPFRPPLHFEFKPGHIISAQPKIKTMIHHFSPTQDKDHDLSFQPNTKQEPLHTQNSPTPWFIISSQNSNNIKVQQYNMSLTKRALIDQKVLCYGLHHKSEQKEMTKKFSAMVYMARVTKTSSVAVIDQNIFQSLYPLSAFPST